MGLFINAAGKILIGTFIAGAATEAATGKDLGVARGCLAVLTAWLFWVAFVLYTIYYIIFK